MTWTYTPVVTTRDQVRLLVGDVDNTDPQVQDEEIDFLLVQFGGVSTAAAVAADSIANRLSRLADTRIGDTMVYLSQKAAAFRKVAEQLRAVAGGDAFLPIAYAGGLSYADNLAIAANPDYVPVPILSTGGDDTGGVYGTSGLGQ